MVRVLVVDDSMFMRHALSQLLTQDSEIQVVDTARDGLDALQKLEKIDCDVITLDVEMPHLDGLETLKEIMKKKPLPVLMVSSLTLQGAETTLKAMEYGALDFIPKDMDSNRDVFGKELRQKVKAIALKKAILKLKYSRLQASSSPRPSTQTSTTHPSSKAQVVSPACRGARDLVVIGVSTGGPPVVQKILAALPGDFPATILISQHMPASFTGPFANRLDNVSKITVTEAVDGEKMQRGHAYVCPGGKHLGIRMRGILPELAVTLEPLDALYKPTVNVLMSTAGELMGSRTLGVMLTGMGSDGVDGARVLREKGGYLIAQSEASCVVYGMPKAVVDANLAHMVLDADDIAEAIIKIVKG